MDILKVKDCKTFAKRLEESSGCKVTLKILNKDHIHYQFEKSGISLGVLCINQDQVSFAPFVTHETAKNEQYLNIQFFPFIDDLIDLLKMFRMIFVCDYEYDVTEDCKIDFNKKEDE